MLNGRWEKRILRATPRHETKVPNSDDVIVSVKVGVEMAECVKYNEELMNYLQKENAAGHETNCDMLIASVNPVQHMREAILTAKVSFDEENNCYVIKFPFGIKEIELKISKRAVNGQ
jgi:hypothetical protein